MPSETVKPEDLYAMRAIYWGIRAAIERWEWTPDQLLEMNKLGADLWVMIQSAENGKDSPSAE